MFREPIRTPVKINDTTYERELPNGKVEIGDKDSVDFKPTAKLKRWGEECSLVLSIPTTEKIAPTIQGEKILWTGRDYGAEFYQGTDGFKFNIILPKKPSTNVFPLDFQSDNLTFHYQPELTSEEIAEGRFRPENVVGSYAVFHTTKRDHILGQTNYGTGKAFHWYRPLIYDNVGHTCWGILDVRQGLRTVTVPQGFLDNAAYPVTIDDTFGWTGGGGSSYNYSFDYIWGLQPCTPASSGTVTQLTVRIGSNARYARPIIYKNGDDTLVCYGDQVSLDANSSNNLALSGSVVGSTEYILCVWIDASTSLYYDSHATYKTAKESETYHATNAPPDPCGWSHGKAAYNEWLDIYATYTPSGGGVSIPIMMHYYQQLRTRVAD